MLLGFGNDKITTGLNPQEIVRLQIWAFLLKYFVFLY